MRALAAVVLALLLAVPLASARVVCQGNVCAGDQNTVQGSCGTRGTESHRTGVYAGSAVEAGGSRECGTFEDGSYEGTTAGVLVRGPLVNGLGNNYGARYSSFTMTDTSGRYEGTFLVVNVVFLESHVGLLPWHEPADPGWGGLLP